MVSVAAGGRAAAALFAVDAEALRRVPSIGTAAAARGDRVVAGEYQAFGWASRSLPSGAGGWRRHPTTGGVFPLAPWWKVPHLDPVLGDIKEVWEPARFGWVYDLVRAWLVTGAPKYPAAFHHVLSDWVAASPPFFGPQWACGQETAIRAIALLHADANLPADDPERARLLSVLGWSGERIADAIGYAVSQRNNHSLSEATALIALGTRLDGLHPGAPRWRATGRRVLERSILDQFEPDGWYIQHSFNYLRLALDQCGIAARALRTRGESLSDRALARLRAAMDLLSAVMAPDGTVPNHGANDGANVIPRSLAPFTDHRPALTAAAIAFKIGLPADIAPDREVIAWSGGTMLEPEPSRRDGVTRGGGWVVARVQGTQVFLRAGRYRSRPSHLDPLQLDVRFSDGPVIVDPGTFLYNGAPPWRNGLVSALVHNGPVINNHEPGLRGPRFLWYLWPGAEIISATFDGTTARIVARQDGGAEREVTVRAGRVDVRDHIPAAGSVRIRWLLHPSANPEQVQVPGGALGTAQEGALPGWFSAHYAERTASRYIDAVRAGSGVTEIVTIVRSRAGASQSPK